jgi:AcrR family transcriptional regulator
LQPADSVRPVHVDGRRARGERTRLRVLEALLALVGEGELRPTAQDVAARANVALRTVYHHFEDVDELRRSALNLQLTRQSEALQPIDPSGDLNDRIRVIVRQLRKLFEAVTPIRRATLIDEHISPETQAGLRTIRFARRDHIARTFESEITPRSPAGRTLLDAIDAATTWESWDYMRTDLTRSVAASERTLALTLGHLLTRRPAPGEPTSGAG